MPGTDVREALRVVRGELPDLPFLPELPARGPGADLTGRALAILPSTPAEWSSTGWRVADRPGRDLRRAAGLLAGDLDAAEELLAGHPGPLKLAVCGPWTLAATLELRNGRKALSDAGAVRDLTQAMAEGLAGHLAEVARRLPGVGLVVQVDEPALPQVQAGAVPTPSGWARLAAVDPPAVEAVLGSVLAAVSGLAHPVVHCCAASPPVALLVRSGARSVSVDAGVLTPSDDDALGEALEAGCGLFLGLLPSLGPLPSVADAAQPAAALWRRLGLAPALLPERVVVTPGCGLAGADPAEARDTLSRCRETARRLADDPEGGRG